MRIPHLHCIVEDTGETLFTINTFGYNIHLHDVIEYTNTEGLVQEYKVESTVLKVRSFTGTQVDTLAWTTLELLVAVSLIP